MTGNALRLSVLFIASWASWLCVSQVMARVLLTSSEPGQAEALIVLSGAPVYAERLRHASAIYHAHRAGLLILTDDGTVGPW